MPVLHPERLNRSCDPVEIFAPHGDIDVAREAPGIRRRFFHVKINRETADHAVFEPGGGERRFYPSCQVKELFHAFLEERIDVKRHGVPSRIIASPARHDIFTGAYGRDFGNRLPRFGWRCATWKGNGFGCSLVLAFGCDLRSSPTVHLQLDVDRYGQQVRLGHDAATWRELTSLPGSKFQRQGMCSQFPVTPSFVNKCFDLIKGASMQAEPRS